MEDLRLDQIQITGWNPRKRFEIEELTDSVSKHGVLQPILVRPAKGNTYELVAGERRVRAAKAAGHTLIPAIARTLSDTEVLEIMVVENGQRSDLHPLEEADGYRLLMDRAGYNVAAIAARMGRSVPYVYDRIRLLQLTDEAREVFLQNRITAGHAVILSRLTPDQQKRAIDMDHGGLWSVERLLWNPDQSRDAREEDGHKPNSVRELQAWVDKHCKFQPHAEDVPQLFPATAALVEEAEKIVPITHDHCVHPNARDGQRVLCCTSWKRADEKPCESAVTGVIVIGPNRGQAFKVCTDKKGCKVHWAKEQRQASRRVAGSKPGQVNLQEKQHRKDEERRKREEAENARWKKAAPDILEALAKKISAAPAGASSALADLVLDSIAGHWGKAVMNAAGKILPRGKTAEDLVRFAGFFVLMRQSGEWNGWREFPKVAAKWGVNTGRILQEVCPAEKAPAKKAKTKR